VQRLLTPNHSVLTIRGSFSLLNMNIYPFQTANSPSLVTCISRRGWTARRLQPGTKAFLDGRPTVLSYQNQNGACGIVCSLVQYVRKQSNEHDAFDLDHPDHKPFAYSTRPRCSAVEIRPVVWNISSNHLYLLVAACLPGMSAPKGWSQMCSRLSGGFLS
jgi:hypothetical protein